MSYDVSKVARLKDAQLLGEKVKTQITAINESIENLEKVGSQANVIESVKVNGTALTIADDKSVDVTVPTKTSDITNDSTYQTKTEVDTAIGAAIAASGHAHFEKVDSIPTADAAEENTLYLVMNTTTNHYDIYAKVGEEVVLLDDTTVDLSNYVTKETGKGLSTNDYTDDEKTKLSNISEGATKVASSTTNGNIVIDGTETKVYEHPTYTAYDSGFYKVTVDSLGHVTAATAVTTSDINPLIPYTTDAETTEMLTEIFGA